ncbi:MAG TPA: alanine racemase [Baekduia sp.]|uniref:alanine racemase n=1 Tax=Baekduia sp. TaxID=2600305 RepID=UPI002D78ABD0|nr:alanine racemase [Baekduia sp.]HET6507713.1 alanine racemase [Baekduia sp.]
MAVRALAKVNLGAVERNVARLAREAPNSAVCAVVKADGYGHGMVPCARAALAGGATWLAVATALEARDLRAGLGEDARILILGALSDEELPIALDADVDISVWTIDRARELAAGDRPARVHVKYDSGLGRLGTRCAEEAAAVVAAVDAAEHLELVGVWTHFATADERGDGFFGEQLARFKAWAEPLRADHPGVLLHAANSAAMLRDAASHFDLVRPGVAIYGLDPFGEDPAARELEPALELSSYVAALKTARPGDSAGYGRRWVASRETLVATVPIGYGDGYRRALTNKGMALLHGRKIPLIGTVSMDNVTFDVGEQGLGAALGDDVVLIGAQGAEQITAEDLAALIDTINYEITTGLTARVPRLHHRDGVVEGSDRG